MFKGVAENQGLTILPGCFGGELNNDRIAVGEVKGRFMLMLGLKVTGESGGLQFDTQSMGNFMQFSKPWLEMVVLAIRKSKQNLELADKIEQTTEDGSILLTLAYLDTEEKKLALLPTEMM